MARLHPRTIGVAILGVLALGAVALAIRHWPTVGERRRPTSAGSQPPAIADQQTTRAAPPPEPQSEVAAPAGEAAAGVNDQQAAAIAPEAVTAEAGKSDTPAPPTFASERILLLAPLNPLIIEFQFTIDGQPHTEALDRLVADVLKLADTDGDGRPLWKEITSSKRFKYGQFGNLAISNDNDHKQIVDRYDIDRDGTVDATELPRFLTRNAGGARAFSTRGTLDFRDLNRRSAATWQLVDADDDGLLSAAEMTSLAPRLASHDLDDNEVLVAADLNPQAALAMPGMTNTRRRRGLEATRLLGPHTDWGSVRSMLETNYSGNKAITADSFPLTPELFTQLDKNGDGRVLKDEYRALNEIEPHVVVAVEFGLPLKETEDEETEERETGDKKQETEESEGSRLRLVKIADPLTVSGQDSVEQPNRLVLWFGGMVLTLYRNDTIEAVNFEQRAQQALAALDANKDGYLEKSEVPENMQAQLGQFEAVDADEDGKAYAGEVVTFLQQQQAALRSQIHAKVNDREDALFSALDADHDERLDSRELESAPQRMVTLDRDGDGLLAPDELPEPITIGLARGNLENMDALFTPPPIVARGPGENTPRWFTAMDANADGAISRREFVGEEEQFAELDANGNGLLETSETNVTDSADQPAGNDGDLPSMP